MILNSQIWKQTIAAAILAVTGQAAWVRAIERAVKEIERSAYWSFDGVTLVIKSTTSGKLYKITTEHTCEATANGHKACKHKAAHRLMIRYLANLGAAQAASETKRVQNWSARKGVEIVETKRASLIDEAGKAVLVKRTVRGEMCNGMDI